ncbi:MAG TPA: RNA polymerase sigma factor [Saprospiraceae bacterium]|nr:RNA polymerase sigma factor [Saprospiraceae bacterium]
MTQNEIISGCKKGNEAAYRFLVDTHADHLMGICVRYLRDHQKAEDAVQETYIQVFRSIHRFENDKPLIAWMSRIAINCCLKELRKTQRLSFQDTETVFEKLVALPEIYDKLNTEEILLMMDKLPDHYRIIFNLHMIEGYSHKEISRLLGIQESLSRTKLTRARKILQENFLINYKKSIV